MPTGPEHPRATAARLLTLVARDGLTAEQALRRTPSDALTRELFYGTMRHFFCLRSAVNRRLARPLREADAEVFYLLLVGAYQLRFARIPDHAAINETVAACRALRRPWAAKLVNGLLRALQRSVDRSAAHPADIDHPPWMVDLLRSDYGTLAEPLLDACMDRAPLTLRINRRKCPPRRYRSLLENHGIAFTLGMREEQVILEQPMPADELPGYNEGLVAIQDGGAGFAATLLAPRPRARILDACAAPGGKLFHLLECQPAGAATALDKSPSRMETLRAEARRLGHTAATAVADARNVDWWDGDPFDTVLLDAPCSGSGTLRRHPDIKILRTFDDLDRYARQQLELLGGLWHTLRPGGSLLYCTCSLFAQENDLVVGEFLATTTNASIRRIALPTGIPRRYGWQLLPTDHRTDGFYYALLTKEVPPT